MAWRNYGFDSKEKFIEWIRKSSSKEIKERLNASDYAVYRLKRCVDPQIFPILSKKEYSIRELKEKLGEIGIKYSLNVVERMRSEGVKFGIFERKSESERWTKEKLDKLLREEAEKRGGKLAYKDVPQKWVQAAWRIYGSWTNALKANGILTSQDKVSKESLLQMIKERGGICLLEELCFSKYSNLVRGRTKELEKEGKLRTKNLLVSNRIRIIVYLPEKESEIFPSLKEKLEERLKEIEKERKNFLNQFKSKKELMEWINKSPPEIIGEKTYLSLEEVSDLKISLKPEIFSVISNPKLTVEEMVQKLEEKGIKISIERARGYRAITTKLGLLEKKFKTYPHLGDLILKIIKEKGGYCLASELRRNPRINKQITTRHFHDTISRELRELREEGKVKITESRQRRIVYLPEKEKEAFEFEQKLRAEATKNSIFTFYKKERKDLENLIEKAYTGEIIADVELKEREKKFISRLLRQGRFSFIPKKIGNMTYYSTNRKNLEDLERLIAYLEGKGKWP